MADTQPRVQDDLYAAVNGEWAATAVIPDDKVATGGFQDLADDVEKTLMADFEAFAAGTKQSDSDDLNEAITLYKQATDFAKRDADGIQPPLTACRNCKQSPLSMNSTHTLASWPQTVSQCPLVSTLTPT